MIMCNIIHLRLKSARKKAGLTQEKLSKIMGFKERQTLAAIESGRRKITAEELLRAMDALNVDLDYFIDNFRLSPGEAEWTWRVRSDL